MTCTRNTETLSNTRIGIVLFLSFFASCCAENFNVTVIDRPSQPILSFVDGTSSFIEIFNPSYIEKGANNEKSGLLSRSQNCTIYPGTCEFCSGSGSIAASVLTFSEENDDGSFDSVDSSSVVFGPTSDDCDSACNGSDDCDCGGTNDPRVVYNPSDQTYYMFYTAYNSYKDYSHLSLATSMNPTDSSGWTRHGAVFPNVSTSISGALLVSDDTDILPNFLYWGVGDSGGDTEIRVTNSSSLISWPHEGEVIISTRTGYFDSGAVQLGPPPLKLSNGDFILFYNAYDDTGYPFNPTCDMEVGWVILDGSSPSSIKMRSNEPLMLPIYTFEFGEDPYMCNIPRYVFVEGAKPLGNDKFQVYFGGGGAVVATATYEVTIS